MKTEIGEQIKQYRIRAGLTQNDVSAALGLNRSTYARQEAQGKISPEYAPKLASLLHVTTAQILFGEPETMSMETYFSGGHRTYEPLILNSGEPEFFKATPLVLSNNERNYIRIIRKLTEQQQNELEAFLINLQNENEL